MVSAAWATVGCVAAGDAPCRAKIFVGAQAIQATRGVILVVMIMHDELHDQEGEGTHIQRG